MAEIIPFRGVRYSTLCLHAGLSAVLAPPYDVISQAQQADLYAKDPHNIIRLILGREQDFYASASARYKEWTADGTLSADEDPAVYVYHQSFSDPVTGAPCPDRIGLICLLKLEDYSSGKVLPHENTLTAAKADRLNLLRATNAQFESIYGLYSDPDSAISSFLSEYDDRTPILERVDGLIGSSHRIERIDSSDAISGLQELLRDKPIFIADGHHRYETSLNFQREIRATLPQNAGPNPADYILITLTAFEDEGLLVLPTHRMISNVEHNLIKGLQDRITRHFTLIPLSVAGLEQAIADQQEAGNKAIGVVLPNDQGYLAVLKAREEEIVDLIPGANAPVTKKLDVSILHNLILHDLLEISLESLATSGQVRYTRDTQEAIVSVQNGAAQAAFLLGRPSVTDVRDVSLAGDKMPQKSTYFYPKLLSGLIMRDLCVDLETEGFGLNDR